MEPLLRLPSASLPCPCGHSFTAPHLFIEHAKNCSLFVKTASHMRYKCQQCQQGPFESPAQLTEHYSTHHNDSGSFHCPNCREQFLNLAQFLQHQVSCSVSLPPMLEMMKRISSQTSTSLPQPPPPVTAKSEVPPTDVNRPFKCEHCVKSFKSKALLDQHMHIHFPPKYTCRYCAKKYRWPPVFYHHQRTCKKRNAANLESTPQKNGFQDSAKSIIQRAQQPPPPPPSVPPAQHFLNQQNLFSMMNAMGLRLPFQPPPTPNNNLASIMSTLLQMQQSQPEMDQISERSPSPIGANSSKGNDSGSSDPPEMSSPPPTTPQSFTDILASMRGAPSSHFLMEMAANVLRGGPAGGGFFNDQYTSPPESPLNTTTCQHCGKEFSSRLALKQHVEGKHGTERRYKCPGCTKSYRWGASYYYHRKSCPAAKVAGAKHGRSDEDTSEEEAEAKRLREQQQPEPVSQTEGRNPISALGDMLIQ
ncbi:hypothetical protein Ciccas_005865, partial [Cichlidogyrus casuarinus]